MKFREQSILFDTGLMVENIFEISCFLMSVYGGVVCTLNRGHDSQKKGNRL